jgi:putative transposase
LEENSILSHRSCVTPASGQTREKACHSGGPTGTYALAAEKHSHWITYTLKSAKEGRVTLDLAAVCHNMRGQRGRHQRETLLYATWGVKHRPLSWLRATYRRRFGIEASYRQSHQARIRTSSRKPASRLLFLGVALVLRNVWGWLHAEVMAQPQRGARHLRPHALRFAHLLLWLMMEVAKHYRLLKEIPVYRDVYERAQAFGIVFNY